MSKIKIDVTQAVTKRLPFKPVPKFDNMCVGFLTAVEVVESDIANDKNWEYAGKTVPRLTFIFEQLKDDTADSDRFYVHSEMLVASTKADGTDRKEEDIINSYMEAWKHVKHTHDAFVDHPNYAPITEAPEFDSDLDIDTKIVIFRKFYNNIAEAFNKGKDGTNPIYDKKYNVTMKLIASGKNDNFLAFPNFTNKGFIEKTLIGKEGFKTDLAFYGSETCNLSGSGQITAAPDGDPSYTQGGISDEVKKALNIK